MRGLIISSLICAVLSVVLFSLRMDSAISFSEPLHVITSGWEQENLLAIWNFKEGRPLYVSRYDIPYNWVIYNWLYYVVYGTVVAAVSGILSLGDAWLPTISRLLTVAGVVYLGVVSYFTFVTVLAPVERSLKGLAFGFAALVAVGPLVGFWGITVRPDIWAMALEITAILAFWTIFRRNRLLGVLVFCALAYAAWAFKQSNVTALGAVGLLLLVSRDWRSLGLLILVMLGAWSLTLLVGSEMYVTSILLRELDPELSVHEVVKILVNFSMKFVPGLVIGGLVVVVVAASGEMRRAVRERWWKEDQAFFPLAGLVLAWAMVLPATLHTGAAENYYFMLSFFLSLFALWGFREVLSVHPMSRFFRGAGVAGWVLQSIAIFVVLTGVSGVLSVRPGHAFLTANKACLDALPRPLFVDDMYLSLPWMTPGSPSFVLFHKYLDMREAGRQFERGGIGGLIEEGYFAALALPTATKGDFEGVSLAGYRRTEGTCPDFLVFLRRP